MTQKEQLELGWKEYGALPELGIDRIHIKVDSGAKTSAIHATRWATFTKNNRKWVKFTVAPYQDDDDTTIDCEMPIKDQRTVTSSNGQTTDRIVIETQLHIGQSVRKIELTLISRSEMRFRMLLGRQAMKDVVIRPDKSHLTKLKGPTKNP